MRYGVPKPSEARHVRNRNVIEDMGPSTELAGSASRESDLRR